jgi:hypothetical protein
MAGIDQTMVSKILNATTPTGTTGAPTVWSALSTSPMKLRLSITASTASASGTEITVANTTGGTVYAAGGWTLGTTSSTVSSAGSAVGVPFITQSLVVQTGALAIQSFDLLDNAGVRAWFGNFNAAPVNVGIGNTFQITGGSGAAAGIQISLA